MRDMLDGYALEIITALVGALTAIIGYAVTVIKNKLTEQIQDKETKEIIENVVKYVEQTAKAEAKKPTSEEKKERAKEKAQEWLSTKGLTVSDTELEILIESAVNGLQGGVENGKKKNK